MTITRPVQAFSQLALFALGMLLGIPISPIIMAISFYRRARAVHADGLICRGQISSRDSAAARLTGPALVRLSGAFKPLTSSAADVFGVEIRMQRVASDDPRIGDQDLLLASFESFRTAPHDMQQTDTADYLANNYSSVAPWWLAGHGPVVLRLATQATQPAQPRQPSQPSGATPTDAPAPQLPTTDRRTRLEQAITAGTAGFTLQLDRGNEPTALADVKLTAIINADSRALRASMWRQGRGLRPLGLYNGIRAVVYPASQFARRLRGA